MLGQAERSGAGFENKHQDACVATSITAAVNLERDGISSASYVEGNATEQQTKGTKHSFVCYLEPLRDLKQNLTEK